MKDPLRTESGFPRPRRFVGVARPRTARRWMLAVIAASLSAAVLTAAVAPGWFGAADKATPTVSSRPDAPAERAPTAMRLYVLPSLSVVAERKSELAKIEREDKADVFQPAARWKGWARPRA